MTGSDTAGGTFTASYNSKAGNQTTFIGNPVTPIDITFNLTNTQTGAFVSALGIEYYSTDANNLTYLGFSHSSLGIVTTSATATVIPLTAKIGDFGTVGTYTYSDGDKETISWQLTDGGNGKAKIVISATELDQFDNLSFTSETSYVIDENGNRYSIGFRLYYVDDGVTVTLSGNKT